MTSTMELSIASLMNETRYQIKINCGLFLSFPDTVRSPVTYENNNLSLFIDMCVG